MDYPPVSTLVSATFDQLGSRTKINVPTPPASPQPVANGQAMEDGGGLGMNAPTTSGTNMVGTLLNAQA